MLEKIAALTVMIVSGIVFAVISVMLKDDETTEEECKVYKQIGISFGVIMVFILVLTII